MATPASVSAAQSELISSLSQEDIPAKLRCAICGKLAVNAFRLPCCEQAICENCQATLPSSCPVCEHSPLSADDCKPHKALRTTIKVFLRTEEKKREASRPKDSAPPTPVEAASSSQLATPTADALKKEAPGVAQERPETSSHPPDEGAENGHRQGDAATKDVEQAQQEAQDTQVEGELDTQPTSRQSNNEVAELEESTEQAEGSSQDNGTGGGEQVSQYGPSFGFDNMNGSFPQMNFGAGNFDQMQMMMAMQNGMPNNGFGPFPPMGLPGMGMDPMTMQSMYMNGGFGSQGMGMNGMNMNVGMGGFGGGPNNNWNGQQSWNVGQDNFNHPNASGMGTGDYSSFNSGFQTGFNQGNYGHPVQFNDYRRSQLGFRGRGRGRGFGGYGCGRGGAGGHGMGGGVGFDPGQGYGNSNNFANGYQEQGPLTNQQYQNGPNGSPADVSRAAVGTPDGGSVKVGEPGQEARTEGVASGTGNESMQPTESTKASQTGNNDAQGNRSDSMYGAGQDRQRLPSEPAHTGSNVGVPGPRNAAFATAARTLTGAGQTPGSLGRSGSQTPTPDVPLNAPKGPKALLRGLPNTSYLTLQARGLIDDGRKPNGTGRSTAASPAIRSAGSRNGSEDPQSKAVAPVSDRQGDNGERENDRDKEHRNKDYDHRDRSKSPSVSRSRSRDRRESRKRRRERSVSASEEERGNERRRRRHRRKHSSYEHDEGLDRNSRSRDEQYDDRSRTASPDESKRSSRRERDLDRRRDRSRDRDRDRDRDRSREHKSSHRSHRDRDHDRRDRDRDRERDRDRDRDAERDREKDRDRKERSHRDRDRDRERRHRGDKRASDEQNSDAGDRGSSPTANGGTNGANSSSRGFEIKGASSRSSEATGGGGGSERRASSSTQVVDIHAAERAARDRERLLKETRRMASLAGAAPTTTKRGRGEGSQESRRRRRKARKGEPVGIEDEEERMRRLEAERESARFRGD
ncbi:hypothetical protein VTK73DRAFT_3576 [Phialemonium thermophilum]|uniref:RING-type domain-containing protein n=1 Tax=Phialemonium thermophilum TaxID=223376 RepID=A0ABR3WY93_9PEZI